MQNNKKDYEPKTVSISVKESNVIRNKETKKDFSLKKEKEKTSF